MNDAELDQYIQEGVKPDKDDFKLEPLGDEDEDGEVRLNSTRQCSVCNFLILVSLRGTRVQDQLDVARTNWMCEGRCEDGVNSV